MHAIDDLIRDEQLLLGQLMSGIGWDAQAVQGARDVLPAPDDFSFLKHVHLATIIYDLAAREVSPVFTEVYRLLSIRHEGEWTLEVLTDLATSQPIGAEFVAEPIKRIIAAGQARRLADAAAKVHDLAKEGRGAEAKKLAAEMGQETVTYAPGFPVPMRAQDLVDKDIPPSRYYIQDMLRTGLAFFIGNPGIGKTPALIQLALAFASGGRWLGALPCRKSTVLYIGVEYDEAYVKEVLLDSTGTSSMPDNLHILTVETFTSPTTAEESIAMLDFYLATMQIEVVIIDVFSGFLPREKFKQDRYRGDYAEFLEYHRLCMRHAALLVGGWHGGKRDKDPETSFNGGQGMWGSAGGGRITMFYDDDQQVRLRSQLRGHERKEWVLEQARAENAHFWCVIDSDPDPIFGSDAQRRIYAAVKFHGTPAEPLTPAGVRAILKADTPSEGPPPDAYIRQTLGRLAERGILAKIGGGYVVRRGGSGGSDVTDGSDGSGGSEGFAQDLHTSTAQYPIQHGSDSEEGWIGAAAHSDAEFEGAIQPIHDIVRSTDVQPDPAPPTSTSTSAGLTARLSERAALMTDLERLGGDVGRTWTLDALRAEVRQRQEEGTIHDTGN